MWENHSSYILYIYFHVYLPLALLPLNANWPSTVTFQFACNNYLPLQLCLLYLCLFRNILQNWLTPIVVFVWIVVVVLIFVVLFLICRTVWASWPLKWHVCLRLSTYVTQRCVNRKTTTIKTTPSLTSAFYCGFLLLLYWSFAAKLHACASQRLAKLFLHIICYYCCSYFCNTRIHIHMYACKL